MFDSQRVVQRSTSGLRDNQFLETQMEVILDNLSLARRL